MPPTFHFVHVSNRHCRIEAETAAGRRQPVGSLRQMTASGSDRWLLLGRRGRPTGCIYPDLASAQAALARPGPELLQALGLAPSS